jgi:tRNA threonylcarbamoyladenosine biosynthesis protein TsaE
MTRIYSENEIRDLALELLQNCRLNLWLFSGEVGSGKTTLISALCTLLGCQPQASSPTYSYINWYHTTNNRPILHADLYRVKHLEQLYELGLDVLLTHSDLVFIEWPDILCANLDPATYHHFTISAIDSKTRKINYTL